MVVTKTGHSGTRGKVQTHCNMKEKLMLPKFQANLHHIPKPSPQDDATLLLFPPMMGTSRESPRLGLSPADPWQSVTQRQLV